MTPAAALALIASILGLVPEVVKDVEDLIAAIKGGACPPYVPVTPELHAAMDDLHARLNAMTLAERAKR